SHSAASPTAQQGFEENASGVPCGFESDRGTSTVCGSEPSAKHDEIRPFTLRTDQAAIEATVLRVNLSFTGARDFACSQGNVLSSEPRRDRAGIESAQAHRHQRDTALRRFF